MSEQFRIYRVQHDDGRGPYRPGQSHLWTDEGHEVRNPNMFEEFGDDICDGMDTRYAHACGFRTLMQAQRWFTSSEVERLDRLGFWLASMWADELVAESEHQLIFGRLKPLRLGAMRLGWGALQKTRAA